MSMDFLLSYFMHIWLWCIPVFWVIYFITGYPTGMNTDIKNLILASILPVVNTLMIILQIQDIYHEIVNKEK